MSDKNVGWSDQSLVSTRKEEGRRSRQFLNRFLALYNKVHFTIQSTLAVKPNNLGINKCLFYLILGRHYTNAWKSLILWSLLLLPALFEFQLNFFLIQAKIVAFQKRSNVNKKIMRYLLFIFWYLVIKSIEFYVINM